MFIVAPVWREDELVFGKFGLDFLHVAPDCLENEFVFVKFPLDLFLVTSD